MPFTLTLIVENLFILPLALALADTGQQQQNKNFITNFAKSLSQLIKNPIILSIALGFSSATLEIQPPELAYKIINILSLTVVGISLFTVGGMLVGLKAKGIGTDLSFIVIGKLMIHPLYIGSLLMLFPEIPILLQHVAILLACMPMFSIFSIIGMRYQYGELCSAALLPTILISFITINSVVWLILS